MAESRVGPNSTGKEFEDASGLYYFGARWYDPELGLWLTPDPAGQFFNPYAYGGDPVNYVDPDGLWRLGFGVVVGWNRRDGWSLGLGVAADDINLGLAELNTDFSHSWNSNGSTTSTFQIGAGACVGLCVGGQAGGSFNSTAGYSASLGGNVGVGLTTYLQAGVEAGTNQYWTTGGDYIGGDIYGGGYAQAVARVSAGYSYGLGAIESGLYARASVFGLSGGYHSAQGWNTGFSGDMNLISYDSHAGFDNIVGRTGRTIAEIRADADARHFSNNALACGPCVLAPAVPYGAALLEAALYASATWLGVQWYLKNDNRDIKNAERELRTNTEFRRWFHREYKPHNKPPGGPRHNPDLDGPAILDAWRQFNGQ